MNTAHSSGDIFHSHSFFIASWVFSFLLRQLFCDKWQIHSKRDNQKFQVIMWNQNYFHNIHNDGVFYKILNGSVTPRPFHYSLVFSWEWIFFGGLSVEKNVSLELHSKEATVYCILKNEISLYCCAMLGLPLTILCNVSDYRNKLQQTFLL